MKAEGSNLSKYAWAGRNIWAGLLIMQDLCEQ